MSANDLELGPIDYVVVEWPADRKPTGEAFPHLVELVDRGIVRVLDLAFVHKEEDGSVVALDFSDLGGDPHLAMFEGSSSGMLGDEDLSEAAAAIEPGCSAALLVYENTFAAPFSTALRKSRAQLVASGRIAPSAIIAALDELEQAEA